jgi:hypothetical protein
MVAAVANANTVFFISEASVVSGTLTGSPPIVSPDRRWRKGFRGI